MKMRVILVVAMMAMIGASCHRSTEVPSVTAVAWRTWVLPADGPVLPTPRSVAIGPANEVALLDTAGRVLVYDAGGTLQRQWKMLDTSVGKPEGLVVLSDGRIVVCDTHYHRLVWFDHEGRILRTVGRHGTDKGEFIYPVGICTDPAENLYVCEYGGNDRVQKFTREGEWLAAFGSFGAGLSQFQRPSGLAWHAGRIYVADAINHRLLVFSDAGAFISLLENPTQPWPLNLPYDVAIAPDGNLYVVEYGAGRISCVTPAGELVATLGRNGSGDNEFGTPWGIAVDRTGQIYVADTKNRRVVALRFPKR
jgi:DNA-binding beta-propeller fold protein YncE